MQVQALAVGPREHAVAAAMVEAELLEQLDADLGVKIVAGDTRSMSAYSGSFGLKKMSDRGFTAHQAIDHRLAVDRVQDGAAEADVRKTVGSD